MTKITRKSPPHGFTLIELLVVISIIGLLASVVLSSLNSARAKGRDSYRISELVQIRNALELYASSNNGNYFSTGGLGKCLGFTSAQTCWLGYFSGSDSLIAALTPYLPKIPIDPAYGSGAKGDAFVYVDQIGSVAWHCSGDPNVNGGVPYPVGPFILWLPDGVTNPYSDNVCKNMGFYACCTSGNGCTESYFCAWPLR